MKNLKDWEIFFLAIKASGKIPHVNYNDRQVGIFVGVTVGVLMMRDGLSLKDAEEKALALRKLFYNEWVKGKTLSPKIFFRNEALTNESISQFAARMIQVREKLQHYRNDSLTESEIYEVACSDKYLEEIFIRKMNDHSVDFKLEINPDFSAEFNGIILEIDEASTVESMLEKYSKKEILA